MTEDSKLNQLLLNLPKGALVLSSWLESEGYSYELQQRYRNSGWLKSIGRGVMIRMGEKPVLAAAITALQQQANVSIHIGGRTALSLLGFSHYLEMSEKETTLFADRGVKLPAWIRENEWDTTPHVYCTSFLNANIGLVDQLIGTEMLKISGSTRAMMECLYLCPLQFPLSEAYELMEGLSTLRPAQVQELLEQCESIKVKRLFLFFAEKAGHAWLKYVDIKNVNIGSGKRSIVPNGVLTSKYQLVLPEDVI